MHDSDRPKRTSLLIGLCVIAAAIILIIVTTAGKRTSNYEYSLSGHYKQANADYCAGYQQAYNRHREWLNSIQPSPAPSTEEAQPKTPDHPSYVECRDLAAQESMSQSTTELIWIANAQIILSVAGVVLLFWNALLAQTTIRATRDVGKDQSRAYAYVEKVIFFEHKDAIEVRPVVKNTGQTPAKNIQIAWRQGSADKFIGILPPFKEDEFRDFGAIGAATERKIDTRTFTIGFNVLEQEYAIDGELRYETIYGEIYSSYFAFTVRSHPFSTKKINVEPMQGSMPAFDFIGMASSESQSPDNRATT